MHTSSPHPSRTPRAHGWQHYGLAATVALVLAACGQTTPPPAAQSDAVPEPYASAGDKSWAYTAPPGVRLNAIGNGDNYLSDQTVTTAKNGWGPFERDRSNGEQGASDGRVITLNGKPYSKGLGVHAASDLRFPLGGQCNLFTADLGLDDEIDGQTQYGSVVFQVFADGKKLFDSGVMRGSSPTKTASVNITGAQELRLVVTNGGDNVYYDHADWADAKVRCSTSSTGGGTGTGLSATYFDNIDFTGPSVSRTDATVNFNWGVGSPDTRIGADTFSARWVGQVEVPASGDWTFYTVSDDGVRLSVDGKKIIENWTDHAPVTDSAKVTLQAGQRYDINLEFYENGGGAVAQLFWESAGQARQVVPQGRLFPTVPPVSLDTNGYYQVINKASGKCATVQGASLDDLAPVIQTSCLGDASEQWRFVATSGGYYTIQARHSGKVMDVDGASQSNNAKLLQYASGPTPNQEFKPILVTTGYYKFLARHSGKAIDVPGCTAADVQLDQFDDYNNDCESFRLERTSGLTSDAKYTRGAWGSVLPMPVVATTAATLPSGKVLLFAGSDATGFGGGGKTYTALFDPATGTATQAVVSQTGHEMFCPGTALLGDGRLLVNGGSNASVTSLYDPATATWTRSGDMNVPRGYNASVTLGSGDVFTVGGSWSGGLGGKNGENWVASSATWKNLPGASGDPISGYEDVYRSDNHAWLFSQGSRVLYAGPGNTMLWYDTTGTGGVASAGLRGDDEYSQNGNAVMYQQGKILKVSGAKLYSDPNTAANTNTYVIDMGQTVSTRKVAPIKRGRGYASSVVLANGSVMTVGGMTNPVAFSDANSVLTPELWNPRSETWSDLDAMATPRNYHSVAVLLPDARVMAAGGGLCGGCATNHQDAEIFTPPYLYASDGSLATRPQIAQAPATASYGGTISVQATAGISNFHLVRLSSVTHTVNNDQRLWKASFTANGGAYTLTAPASSADAPPGHYMLFALNSKGVPSVAKIVKLQ